MTSLTHLTPSHTRQGQRPARPYLSALLGALLLSTATGQIIVTTLTDEDDGPSSLDNLADVSLREAINHSSNNSEIIFASDLDGRAITLTLGQLTITRSLDLNGTSLPNGIVINANQESRVIRIDPSLTVTLHNLTLTGGNTPGTNFPDSIGGAIFNDSSTLSLFNCTLSENSANDDGGGIYIDHNGTTPLTLTLTNCTFFENTANDDGGGIFSNHSANSPLALTLTNCTFSGNTARRGGGIHSSTDSTTLSHCTLSGNSANFGGGIFNTGTNNSTTLSHCTVSGNSANSFGGGISSNGRAALNLENTILADNTAANATAAPDLENFLGISTITIAGTNLLSSTAESTLTNTTAGITVIAAADLNLATLGNHGGFTQTRPPLSGSPAIDAGSMNDPGGTDQRGFDRFFGDRLDIGSVESQGDIEEFILTFQLDSDSDGSSNGLEIAIGTDPFVADRTDPRNLNLVSISNGVPAFTFGLANTLQPNIILKLTRSSDLITFDEVVASNEVELFTDSEVVEGLLMRSDDSANRKAFYRLEATLR